MKRRACTAAPWPTPTDLINAPELATLALVDRALELLGHVLVAAHPELLDTQPGEVHPDDRLSIAAGTASTLLRLREITLEAIAHYRNAVAPIVTNARTDDSDLPF